MLALACVTPTPAVTVPTTIEAPELPAVEAEPPKTCVDSKIVGGDSSSVVAWLGANTVDASFTCPAELQLVQREPWLVATTILLGYEPDQVGPTRRVAIGERLVFSGLDPATGDSLMLEVGRIDDSAFELVRTEILAENSWERASEIVAPGEPLAGDWRGLNFVARSGQEALVLRGWLEDLPADANDVWFGPVRERALDESESAAPKLLLIGSAASSTICIEAADERGCWRTEPIRVAENELSWASELDRLDFRDRKSKTLVASFDLRSRTWLPRQGRSFVVVDSLPSPALPESSWLAMLAPGWLAAGGYTSDRDRLERETRWLLRHQAGSWSIGALHEGVVHERVEWPGIDEFGVIVGNDDASESEWAEFLAFRRRGDWLMPAGRLPSPSHRRHGDPWLVEWEYRYDIEATSMDRCIEISLASASSWQYGGGSTSAQKLQLPMPDLAGDWRLGPEGLVRGCE